MSITQLLRSSPDGGVRVTAPNPLPGIWKMDLFVPVHTLAMSFRIKLWISTKAEDLYRSLRYTSPPELWGKPVEFLANEAPIPEHLHLLDKYGYGAVPLIFDVQHSRNLRRKITTMSGLQEVADQFCAWIADITDEPKITDSKGDEICRPTDVGSALEEVNADRRFSGETQKTRTVLAEARMGQGRYRRQMLQLWGGRCAVTGCDVERAIVASHAKSWATCDISDALNPYNGLPLVASLDRLFDAGIIAFADSGRVLKNDRYSWESLRPLGVNPDTGLRFVLAGHLRFLQAHRKAYGYPV